MFKLNTDTYESVLVNFLPALASPPLDPGKLLILPRMGRIWPRRVPCQEGIYVFRVYFFENQDRFLQYGLIAEYRCFNSVWHSPGAVHSQILKRIGHREAYDRHRYMCTHFGAKMSLGHANLSEFNHMISISELRQNFASQ